MGSFKSFLSWSRSRDATFPLLLKGVLATGSAHARPSDRAPHRHKREKKLPNVSDHFSSSGGARGVLKFVVGRKVLAAGEKEDKLQQQNYSLRLGFLLPCLELEVTRSVRPPPHNS
jgi:hypothetical protein